MRGLPSILSLFHNEFNEFNETGARMLDFHLSYNFKIALKSHFGVLRQDVVIMYATLLWMSFSSLV